MMKRMAFGLAYCVLIVMVIAGPAKAQSSATQPSETRWLKTKEIKPGPKQRDSLTTNQISRIKILQRTFAEVDGSSLEKWMDDFKHDEDPERELQVWEAMAKAYRTYCSAHALTLPQKHDVMSVLLLRSGASESEVLQHLDLKVLTVMDAKDIVRLYKIEAMPIQVREKK